MSAVLLIGAGGHAKVVADIFRCCDVSVSGLLDDDAKRWNTTYFGLPVLGAPESFADHGAQGLILAIGSNAIRRQLAARLLPAQDWWQSAIHPRAIVAASARVGQGSVIGAGAVINADSIVGDHAIINTGASVDHDCQIGNFAHLAPGVHLAGNVKIGEGAFLGIGSVVTPGVQIGDWAIVGAGSVVLRDVPARSMVYGVPAKLQKISGN